MANKTQICNLALSWLGGNLIPQDVDTDTTVEAQICKANYDLSKQMVLTERVWSFATQYNKLDSPTGTEPPFRYEHEFNLPEGTLMIHRVFDQETPTGVNGTLPNKAEWERVGDKIYANSNPIFVVSVVDVADDTKLPIYFVHALAARIAADICISISENRSLQSDMYTLYGKKLEEAAAADGRQAIAEVTDSRLLTDVRRM